ncbi:hypothetical protein B0H11DRAFT_1900603 [Mycena galericulata]|nr:hypothetical protein B0H11DRAFT_1900603 [Mycena galericulata]
MAAKRRRKDEDSEDSASSTEGEFQPSGDEDFADTLGNDRRLRSRAGSNRRAERSVEPIEDLHRTNKSRKTAPGASASQSRSRSGRERSPATSSRRAEMSAPAKKPKGKAAPAKKSIPVVEMKSSSHPVKTAALVKSEPAPTKSAASKSGKLSSGKGASAASTPVNPPPLYKTPDPKKIAPKDRFLNRPLPPRTHFSPFSSSFPLVMLVVSLLAADLRIKDANDEVFDFNVEVGQHGPIEPSGRSTHELSLYFRAYYRKNPDHLRGSEEFFRSYKFWDTSTGKFVQRTMVGGPLSSKGCFRWVRAAYNTLEEFVRVYPPIAEYVAASPAIGDRVFDHPNDPIPEFRSPSAGDPPMVEEDEFPNVPAEELQQRNDDLFREWHDKHRVAVQKARAVYVTAKAEWTRRHADYRAEYLLREARNACIVERYLSRRDDALLSVMDEILTMSEFAIVLEDWEVAKEPMPVVPPMSRSPSPPVVSSSKVVPVASSSKSAPGARHSQYNPELDIGPADFLDDHAIPPINVQKPTSDEEEDDDDGENLPPANAAVDQLDPSSPPSAVMKGKGKAKAVAPKKIGKVGKMKLSAEELKKFIETPACFVNARHPYIHEAFYSAYHLNEPLSWDPPMRDAPRGEAGQVRLQTHGTGGML